MIDYSTAKSILESKNFYLNKKSTKVMTEFNHTFKNKNITLEINWKLGGFIKNINLTVNNSKENVFDIDNFFLHELENVIINNNG
jgi:hypothetical protein